MELREQTLSELIAFVNNYSNVYIYGAGVYGQYYNDIFQQNGLSFNGFIVTQKVQDNYLSRHIYSAEEIKDEFSEEMGVICAIKGIKHSVITDNLRGCNAQVLFQDLDKIFLLWMSSFCQEIKNDLLPTHNEGSCNKDNWKKILVTRLDAIGDVVCTTAFLRELKRNCPQAEIHVVIQEQNESILCDFPYINYIHLYKGNAYGGAYADKRKNYDSIKKQIESFVMREFNGIVFDASFNCASLILSRNGVEDILMTFMCDVKERYAYIVDTSSHSEIVYQTFKDMYQGLYFEREQKHIIDYMLDMLVQNDMDVQNNESELCLKNHVSCIEKTGLSTDSNYIYIAVGVVGSTPERNWDPLKYNEVFCTLKCINNKNIIYVLFGGSDATEAAGMAETDCTNVNNLTGKLSLKETIDYINSCQLYFGADTGLLHIAAALHKPCVPLYAYNKQYNRALYYSPIIYGVRGAKHIDIIPKTGLDGCTDVCKKKYAHCINQIKVEEVMAAINKLLSEGLNLF